MKKRIAIVDSHPIQYHAHWYRELARRPEFDFEVLYSHRASPADQAKAGFGVEFEWDIALLDGYRHRFLRNVAKHPSVTEFAGTDTPEIRDILVRERFDSVVVSGWHTKSYWQTIRACWQTGRPVMARSDSHLHTPRSLLKQALKWPLYRYFISKLDGCLPVGTWSREYFLHYGAKPQRVFVVPHCVPEPSQAAEADKGPLRERWGIPANATVFLFAGKFVPRKQPGDFIRAVAQAAESHAAAHGLLTGDGPLRAEMETLAARLRAPVTFTGFLNQTAMADAYTAADVLTLPSSIETWGLVANEAMVRGLPCIASDRVGCGPDLVTPGETGFVFRAGDVDAMTACIQKFAGSPDLAVSMGLAARKRMEAHSA
ncbi:MAG TPA: glycosyltransferase family 4 protein [Bryobacteraceae bacterium]|jgi:glycosyltransferase involved in cell wall biosynthesis